MNWKECGMSGTLSQYFLGGAEKNNEKLQSG
jgi:hypothetical protein